MNAMKKDSKTKIVDCISANLYFKIFSIISIGLIITAFFIPPTAFVDGSVLAAVGELFGFAALGTVIKAIDKGTKASVRHNGTELTVGDDDDEFDRPPHSSSYRD